MIEAKFIEVSEKVDGIYKREDASYKLDLQGSTMPVTKHFLRVDYKSNIIDIQYEFGNTNVAQVVSSIRSKRALHPLKLTTKSHLGRLFSRSKHPWTIKCKDSNTKTIIENTLEQSGLKELAEERAFEPDVEILPEGQFYKVKTHFYLGFDNKEDSLLPVVNFYKKLIDFGFTLK